MSESELSKVKNLGKKSLEEIKDKLVELGFGPDSRINNEVLELFKNKLSDLKG